MSHESFSTAKFEEGFASSTHNEKLGREWTVESVGDLIKSNILKFTKAKSVDVSTGEDVEGHKMMDIRVNFDGNEEPRMISLHVTGPEATSISDLLLLAESKEQLGALFSGSSIGNEGNIVEAAGLADKFGDNAANMYDDPTSMAA